jgi:hypothetical protein
MKMKEASALPLLALAVAAGCSEPGRSLVLVDVVPVPDLGITTVRIFVSQPASSRSWSVDHVWPELPRPPLLLGVYVPKDVRGPVTVFGCGFDASGTLIASGVGIPSSVTLEPGTSTPEVTVPISAAGLVSAAACSGADAGVLGGGLAIARADLPSTVDLTAEGTLDWAHWGMSANGTFDHKASGGLAIDLSPQSPGVTTSAETFTWSDGMPTQSATVNSGIYMQFGCGPPYFTWTVPAGTTPRTLRLYISADATTTLTAHLSDGSAPDAVLTDDNIAATISFRAATDQQTMSVTWTPAAPIGSFSVWAATLN